MTLDHTKSAQNEAQTETMEKETVIRKDKGVSFEGRDNKRRKRRRKKKAKKEAVLEEETKTNGDVVGSGTKKTEEGVLCTEL